MRQPLTDSELREKLKEMFSLPSGQDGQMQSVITNQTIKKLIYLIKQDRQAHALAARVDELERLIGSGAAGDKYRTKAKHGFVTIEERLEQLKEQSDE